MRYDRAELLQAYLAAHASAASRFGAYEAELDDYNDALRQYYRGLLAALERVFGVELDIQRAPSFDAKVFLMLFRSTADSCIAARTPWSRFSEAGLLLQRIEGAGAAGQRVLEASRLIEELHVKSREAHLGALDALVEILLGDTAKSVFTSADVRAAGFDDSARPNPADYPDFTD